MSAEPLHPPAPPRLHPDVVWRRLGGTVVLIHVPSSQIFELNATGARIWELLSDGRSEREVLDLLVAEFDVDEDRARREMADLLHTLHHEQLLA